MSTGSIRPLDTSVVNRIAAGEIIIAPVNALKEMLENSIDAQATSIEVIVKDGGLKLLQINDNGTGIVKEDLPMLCQRFTTSKLTSFEDLASISTYGFRGEALASISHISHVSVITRTKEDSCAWKAVYSNGELIPPRPNTSSEPKPVAGKQGTQILVEDLFFNVRSRLHALKSPQDEFSKILDVMGRYAIHTDGVGFACKRFGDSHFALTTRPNLSIKERIRTVFGSSIANELIPLELEPITQYGVSKIVGQITNPNYNNKKSVQPVFFINNRLISNDSLKRALLSTINHFLPKGHKPFIYLSILIKPENVDVNVHPTKREVKFLFEDEIIDHICTSIIEQFENIDSSRKFPTHALLNTKKSNIGSDQSKKSESVVTSFQNKKTYDYNLVRTDASQSKITTFLAQQTSDSGDNGHDIAKGKGHDDEKKTKETDRRAHTVKVIENYKFTPKERVDVELQSIYDLRAEIENNLNKELTEVFAGHSYVGIVDETKRLAALQYDVNLMIFDYASVLNSFFYQLSLANFSNYGKIFIQNGIPLVDLLSAVYDGSNFLPSKSIDEVVILLNSMSQMLNEYFSIEIENSTLRSIPLLVENYTPPLSKLPLFLYRLGNNIDWQEEKDCLSGILRQIALLYIPESIPSVELTPDEVTTKPALIAKSEELNEVMETVLMPLIKKKFLATKDITKDVVEVANLPGLYRVFERC